MDSTLRMREREREREVKEQCVFEAGVLFSASTHSQIHPKPLYMVEYILNCHGWLCFRVVPARICSAYKAVVMYSCVRYKLIYIYPYRWCTHEQRGVYIYIG